MNRRNHLEIDSFSPTLRKICTKQQQQQQHYQIDEHKRQKKAQDQENKNDHDMVIAFWLTCHHVL